MNTEARNKAIDLHNRALEAVKTDLQLAYRLLCSATVVDPDMAVGWYAMGNALADLKKLPASVAAFRRCLACQIGDLPGDLTPELRAKATVNLGHRLVNNGEVEEGELVARQAIAMLEADPSLDQEGRAFAWTNLSLALSVQGKLQESLENARKAYEMSPIPIIETALGFAYLFNGDYAPGLKHFDARFGYSPVLAQFRNYPYDRWDGKKSGTLFVAADQGLGDTVSFSRFIPRAARRVKKLIYGVQPDILRMMTAAFAGLKNVSVIPQSANYPLADFWSPVVSLPVALGLTTEEIRKYPQSWEVPETHAGTPDGWKAPDRTIHIGIAYAGSASNDIDRWRSIPIEEFLALYRVPGVQLYSLQVGDRVKDLHDAGCAALIRDMSPWIKDAIDTAAIMRELDLIVSIESFVPHLAAAVGKECWVPLSYLGGDYRCGRSGDRPLWYPDTRLFRLGPDEGWDAVFGRIVEALGDRPGQ